MLVTKPVVSQKDGSQLFVTDSATPVPLKVISGGTTKGTMNFTDYGKAQNIQEPAGALTPQGGRQDGHRQRLTAHPARRARSASGVRPPECIAP